MYKYELHAHTSECDLAARLGGGDLVRLYKEAGYDGIVITDHYFELFFLWFREELEGLPHTLQMRRWQKGYLTAKAEGEKLGFTVLPGAEVRFNSCPNDYLLYGLPEDFFSAAPRLNELESLRDLALLLPEQTCVVQAHPFRDGMVVQSPESLFGIEVFNGGTGSFRNELACRFAEHYSLAKTSGSDIHGIDALAKGGILTDRRIRTPEDLSTVLRSGDYALIEPSL